MNAVSESVSEAEETEVVAPPSSGILANATTDREFYHAENESQTKPQETTTRFLSKDQSIKREDGNQAHESSYFGVDENNKTTSTIRKPIQRETLADKSNAEEIRQDFGSSGLFLNAHLPLFQPIRNEDNSYTHYTQSQQPQFNQQARGGAYSIGNTQLSSQGNPDRVSRPQNKFVPYESSRTINQGGSRDTSGVPGSRFSSPAVGPGITLHRPSKNAAHATMTTGGYISSGENVNPYPPSAVHSGFNQQEGKPRNHGVTVDEAQQGRPSLFNPYVRSEKTEHSESKPWHPQRTNDEVLNPKISFRVSTGYSASEDLEPQYATVEGKGIPLLDITAPSKETPYETEEHLMTAQKQKGDTSPPVVPSHVRKPSQQHREKYNYNPYTVNYEQSQPIKNAKLPVPLGATIIGSQEPENTNPYLRESRLTPDDIKPLPGRLEDPADFNPYADIRPQPNQHDVLNRRVTAHFDSFDPSSITDRNYPQQTSFGQTRQPKHYSQTPTAPDGFNGFQRYDVKGFSHHKNKKDPFWGDDKSSNDVLGRCHSW